METLDLRGALHSRKSSEAIFSKNLEPWRPMQGLILLDWQLLVKIKRAGSESYPISRFGIGSLERYRTSTAIAEGSSDVGLANRISHHETSQLIATGGDLEHLLLISRCCY